MIGSLVAQLLCVSAVAHLDAVTMLAVEVNERERTLECALRIFPEMLESALSREANATVQLHRSSDVDDRIVRYLASRLSIRPAGTEPSKLPTIRWVGKEVSPRDVWIYFEIPYAGDLERIVVTNRILTDLYAEQFNTVNLTWGRRLATCSLSARQPRQAVRWRDEADASRLRPRLDGQYVR
jgi:hypothetical protein